MSAGESSRPHPYLGLTTTAQWAVIDRAVLELAENRDLVETTSHEYIVGYLCKALADRTGYEMKTVADFEGSEHRRKALDRVRKAVKQANPTERDLVRELIEERRAESQSE